MQLDTIISTIFFTFKNKYINLFIIKKLYYIILIIQLKREKSSLILKDS